MELSEIKGIGAKRIEALKKAGIFSAEELLHYFPLRYIDMTRPVKLSECRDGEEVGFAATVEAPPLKRFIRKGLSMVKVKLLSNGETVSATWFNQPFIVKALTPGKSIIVTGRIKKFKNSVEIAAPSLCKAGASDTGIIPVYKGIKGLPASLIKEAMAVILSKVRVSGYFESAEYEKFSLIRLGTALKDIHQPASVESAQDAAYSVAKEQLAIELIRYRIMKQRIGATRRFVYKEKKNELEKFISALPFSLTIDQRAAIDDILNDLNSPEPMNRLLEGDVGSGKTVVAFSAMYFAALNGYQSVIMAPTEILARQHYKSALKMLGSSGVTIEYLSAALSKKQQDTARFNINNGVADIVIGTHSLLGDGIDFPRLSLVITDEQHRFGVVQRGTLENKALGTDTLVMSATPIPRTLALTFYGDLKRSCLLSAPKGKAEILTRIVPGRKFSDMFDYVLRDALSDKRTYIVCPRIERDEYDDSSLYSACELYAELRPRFEKVGIGLIHGAMKDAEKTEAMNAFSEGRTRVLVATTVIEVGIDVKEAVNMIILNAERYGLSQLHQLRGRVGRGTEKSYCFIMSDKAEGATKERLEYFIANHDGFKLAEYDFSERGAGDFLGTRQHGDVSRFGSVRFTKELLSESKELAEFAIERESLPESGLSAQIENMEYIRRLTLN